MNSTTATSSVEILNDVEKAIREYVEGKKTNKDELKEYLYDTSKALLEEVKGCKDLSILKATAERIEQFTEDINPKELMIIGFYNRFGKVIDELDARVQEIRGSMKLEDIFAAKA